MCTNCWETKEFAVAQGFCLTTVSTFMSQDKAVTHEWHTHKKTVNDHPGSQTL